MTKPAAIAILTAALLAFTAGTAAATDHSARPATAVATTDTTVTALFVPTDGRRVSTPRAKRHASHPRGPVCSYVCHWHGEIKHCFPACR